jgi:hypothetical protein
VCRLGVYITYHAHLFSPLFDIVLIDTDSINPKSPVAGGMAEMPQNAGEILRDSKLLSVKADLLSIVDRSLIIR